MTDSAKPAEISLAQYRDYLRSLARARFDPRLQGELDPSDVVQETLLKAHKAIDGFRGQSETELVAWLKTILVNTLKNALRALGRRNGTQVSLNTTTENSSVHERVCVAQNQPRPEQAAAWYEEQLLIADAIGGLSDSQRAVIEMRYVRGYSLAKICELTTLTKPAVVGLLYRGLKTLRAKLSPTSNESEH
jgi:RNA polymerase sigma-70 factor, ECF subfamily